MPRRPADFLQLPVQGVRSSPWIELSLVDGTLVRIPQENHAALTTLLPLTRQTLSMAAHKSLPRIFGRIHPRFLTPFWGTVILGTLSIVWYVLLTWLNPNALLDAISAIGISAPVSF